MANQINMKFDNGTEGTITNPRGQVIDVSFSGQNYAPYELFLGGYASCLHATFRGIMIKRKLDFDHIEYQVIGHKREEVPTYLEKVETIVTIYGANQAKEKQILKSLHTAERYCSISYTIIKLDCEMDLQLVFK